MDQAVIFKPMGALVALTFLVVLFLGVRRIGGVLRGELEAAAFRVGETAVPEPVAVVNRNYMNLLELPALFYPICVMFYVTGRVGPVVLATAWTFVALRAVHSLVHLTTNNVLHRLVAFACSNIALAALWLMFFLG